MKRPWQVWLVFGLCVVGAAVAMVWLSQQALRTDDRRRAAEAETELEQEVSLALWRMDTALAPIIAAEVIRPPSAYRSPIAQVPNPPAQQQLVQAANPSTQQKQQEAPTTPQLAQVVDPPSQQPQQQVAPLRRYRNSCCCSSRPGPTGRGIHRRRAIESQTPGAMPFRNRSRYRH
jgi:hypothetical protein